MIIIDRITLFSSFDLAALALLFLLWMGIGWRIEHPSARHPSTSMLIAGYRKAWMREMVTRQPRIFDAQILGTLRQGTAFFASTCVIALGGTLALIGNADRVAGVAEDITQSDRPAIVWQIKLMVLALLLTNAFLKFVWANRLFGYCSVLMAAVPNNIDDPKAYHRAEQAAEINIAAARSFNRGLRSIYFALAAAAWLVGAWALALAALITFTVIWRREFASHSRKVLLNA
ncbi:DUF599 domain-containing protein [Roseobacter weihaiensis]|uniref:DUF599 domain-containing protein n=1 Tax=Roseobacter weihaiensis TaxID=2763262 RepID=UPI001D0A2E72|nr:DUF599 domain-containing protein [Roseobacter sp. H9]